MEFLYYETVADSGCTSQIRQLLVLADKEFIPPLSDRSSTTQASLSYSGAAGSIDAYYTAMQAQPVIIAREDGKTAGFMAFRFDHTCQQISIIPNLYASTCVVHPEHRGKGLMRKFYEELFTRFPQRSVFTRTWSTNAAHLHVLEKLGFCECARLKDHRGEGLDTVYFCREPV